MHCPNCSRDVAEGLSFCGGCGASLTVDVAALLRRPVGVTLLAIVDLMGALALGAIAAWLLLGSGRQEANGIWYVGGGGVTALLAALHVSAAVGLLGMRGWGRGLQIVLAALSLVLFPFGTVIGILVLWYLLTHQTAVLFRAQGRTTLDPTDLQVLSRNSGTSVALPIIAAVLAFLTIPAAGCIAAIAVPNFLNAVQRGKQKRTMGDIRTIATAVESYAIDETHYPGVGSVDELPDFLVPTYIKALPTTDGWSNAFAYEAHVDDELGVATEYWIGSAGKDGEWSTDSLLYVPSGPTTDFDSDIVFANASFVTWPEGTQE